MTIFWFSLLVGAYGALCYVLGTRQGKRFGSRLIWTADDFRLDENREVKIDDKEFVIKSFIPWPLSGSFMDDTVETLDVSFSRNRSWNQDAGS